MRSRAVTNRTMRRSLGWIMGSLSCIGACGGHTTNNGVDSPTTAEGGASKGGAGETNAGAAAGASSGGQLSRGGQGGGESGANAVLGGAPAAQGGETTGAGAAGEPSTAEGGAAGVSAGGAEACLPACEPSCVVGAVSCLSNRLGICDSDGMSLASTTSDCAASGQVCDQFQLCALHATDVLGGVYDAVPTKSGEILVDIVDVFSARVAAGLEAELVLHVDTTLTWVIYEWHVNRFKLGFATAVNVPANFNGPPGTEQLYGSSLFSYTLHAGKRYALGLVVGDGVSVNPSDSPDGRELSFGHFVGGATAEGIDFHDQSSFQPTSTVNLLGIYTLPVR